jgi:hypothetical protein
MKLFTFLFALICSTYLQAQLLNEAQAFGSSGIDMLGGVATHGSRSLVAGGSMGGSTNIYLGADTLSNNGFSDCGIVVKYYDDGNYHWGFAMNDPNGSTPTGIYVTADNSIYLIGTFNDSVSVGYKANAAMITKDPANLGTVDAFVAKLDSNGSLIWSKVFQNDGFNNIKSITYDGTNLIVAGDMEKTIYYENRLDSIQAPFKSGFVAFLNPSNGNYLKGFALNGLTGDASVNISGIGVHTSGNLLVAGNYIDSVDFDPSTGANKKFNGGTGFDIFLASYNTSTTPALSYVNVYGGSTDDYIYGFSLDGSDHVWMTGFTNSSFSFGPSSISANSSTDDILILHFDDNGNPVKGLNLGNSNTSEGGDIKVFGSGDVWVCGKFQGVIDFDPGSGTFNDTASTSSYSGFIAKYDRQLNYLSSFRIGDRSADEEVVGLALRSNDRVFAVGMFQSATTDFDPGVGTETKSHNGDGDAFWAEYTITGCSIDPAGSISGPKTACVGEVGIGYTLPEVSGATGYTWVPTTGNASIVSGQGTRFITLDINGAGNVSLRVTPTDGNCSGQGSTLNITVHNPPTIGSINLTNPTCGQKNGQLSLLLTGNLPLRHIWSNGDTNDSPFNIPSGTYSYTGYDANGCSADTVLTLNDNGAPSIDSLDITSVLCFGDATGAIDLHISGGTLPYSIRWSNGDTTEDISALEAGGYRVVIADAAKCMSARIIDVPAPRKLEISVTEQHPTTCGLSNGAILLGVSGGKTPYSYQWNTGDIFDAIASKPTGNYWCKVSDDNNCSDTVWANLSDAKGPNLVIDTLIYPTCGQADGEVNLTTSFTASMSYSWSPAGGSAEDLANAAAGRYTLHINSGSCDVYKTFELHLRAPDKQEICMVTVDDSSSLNTVVWEKGLATGVKQYNIYRESYTPGFFHNIGTWPADSISYWIDPISEPGLKSWTYRIDAESPCGAHSVPSPVHRTVHIVMNSDTAGAIRINWTCYAGFAFTDQKIGRFRSDISNWESIDTLNQEALSYKDVNVPKVQRLQYAVIIDHPIGCLAQRASSKNFNSSRSNRSMAIPTNADTSSNPIDTTKKSVEELEGGAWNVALWPNPSTGLFNVSVSGLAASDFTLRLLDIQGKEVGHTSLSPLTKQAVLDLNAWPDGMYILQVSDGITEHYIRLIKQ